MSTHTLAHFYERTELEVTRADSGATRVTISEKGKRVTLFLIDGNTGPSLLIDLHALITRELIDRGYRSEVDSNVTAAVARKFQVEATA